MPTNVNIQRLALQKTRVAEIHLPPIPSIPASLLKFPGVIEWERQLRLMRERDQEQLYRAILNASEAAGTPGPQGEQGEAGAQGPPGEDGEDGADGAAGGAPDDATYIVQTPHADLTAEQALSLLSTGLLKSTTGTGVVSIAVAGTDYQTPLTAGVDYQTPLTAGVDYEVPLTFTAPLSRAGNIISIPQANGSTDGFLDSADWTTFNNKQDALPVVDTHAIVKGSADATKLLRFEVDGFTTSTTRVLTPQDSSYIIAGTNIVNTFTSDQSFEQNVSFGVGAANIDASGSYVGPLMDVEQQLTVETASGSELSIRFQVYNTDTATETFHILGDGSFVADGSATIGTLSGVIVGTAGLLSATAIAQGDLFYGSADGVLTALAKNTTATRYLANTGASNNPAWAQIDLTNGVTGDLPFSSLAQGSALSVLGVTGNATADNASIAAGSDHQVLRRSGTTLAFGAVNLAQSAAVTGTLGVGNGGTGTATTFTQGSVIFAGASGIYSQDNSNLFWDDTNNRFGVGIVTTSSMGTLTVSRTQTSATLAAADAHLLIHNPSASAQTLVVFTSGAGFTVRGGVRADVVGNFNWHAPGAVASQGHVFYGSTDTSLPIASFSDQGVCVGRAAGVKSTARIDSVSRSITNIVMILEGFAGQTGDMLRVRTSGSVNQFVINASGDFALTPSIRTTGNPVLVALTGPAHTGLTASAEVIDVNWNLARTVQRATGAVTTQRAFLVQAPTYSFVGSSTITTAATLAITAAPTAGTNATITNAYALWVQAGISRFDGNLSLNDGVNVVIGTSTGSQIATGAAAKLGFWGATPVVQNTDWAVTNVTPTKSFDADTVTLPELADVVGTLIDTLIEYGILGP